VRSAPSFHPKLASFHNAGYITNQSETEERHRVKDATLTCDKTAIHSLTDTCFKKCIPAGGVKNGKLDKYEEPCVRQCVDRFLDANLVVLRELERLRG
jgi:hypothetical protein